MRSQPINAFPLKPETHEQDGACPTTRHSVLEPHDPGHGSIQRALTHAVLLGQSLLMVHSGRQFGAFPIILDWQEHCGTEPDA